VPECPSCSEANPEHARFCSNCGTPLAPVPEPRAARKIVTVVFTDVAGFTGIGERLDPETLRRVMTQYFDHMRDVLEHHGGTVEKFIGDAVMAVFGVPTLHEDDALRATRAAVQMRDRLAELNERLDREWGVRIRVRTGVNTGEVVAGDPGAGQSLVVGDAVNVAARLEQAATPGEILLGPSTQRLVRDAVEVESTELLALKGRGEPVRAFRLLSIVPGAPAFARRLDSPMIGRERERLLLQQAFDRAVEDQTCHLFTVLGAAGVGKSRLASEVITACSAEALVLSGRSLPYGEGITFWPVIEIVRAAAGLTEDDSPEQARGKIHEVLRDEEDRDLVAARVAQLVGLPDATAELQETWWGVRRFLEALARRRPLIVIFDDLQWAEPVLLDLIDHAAERTRNAPVLLVCLARPEMLDARPGWSGGKVNATSILLEPLSPEASETLIENLLGQAELAADARTRIAAAAEGNPLFVEEMLAMLIDEGKLRRDDGRWIPTTDLADVAVPPTIQALLASRLDQLTSDERAVIERAAVEGKIFHVGAVAELVPEWIRDRVEAHLDTLVLKELIRPERASFVGQDAFAFRHILIRDEAYRGTPKETRAELHERFAAWLERSAGGWLPEYQEIVGYHLEQSHRARADLGRIDAATAATGRRAAEHLEVAGRRAVDRGDVRAAANMFERALALLTDVDARLVRLRIRLAEVLGEIGEFARAEEVLERAMTESKETGDERLASLASMQRATLRINTDPGNSTEDARRDAEQAIRVFTELGDDEGLARAWWVLAYVHWNEARADDTAEAIERSIHHATAAGDLRLQATNLAFLAGTASWGAAPVEEGIRRIDAILERAGGHRLVESSALTTRGALAAQLGRFDEARATIARGRRILDELGQTVLHAATAQEVGRVEMLAEDPVSAEREFRAGYETLERLGERAYLSTVAAMVADALYEQGRLEEAHRFTQISEEASDPGDLASQISWRMTRGRILARRGEPEEGERLVRDAVTLAEGTDFLDTHADTLMGLADVLEVGGRREEAAVAIERALKLYERKGATVLADRARHRLADVRT